MTFTVVDGLVVQVAPAPGQSQVEEWIDADLPQLTAYRTWMRDTHPEDFAELFVFGATILLNTDEEIGRHQELVAEYVAGTAAGG